ncbi:hypothetical protein DICPUDRAFT_55402 [Dictyostelium purpureum]|uniref:Gfo/Idh/MocA-like oxidoreductase N-terminal domain-containing protein n=1 Tax=Dictyostelium purpureum TaxID=5786 RepID=F0ZLY0_DICPU|nr:uncharacterized protein DICPUDRAFT_55402 [Dictyostelium purpureum]EGC35065.1 hypothetical protein DICPUDRAFT_55402 [Dictyostelium purpureum]|eukprot:XP_003288433.1 hypothetical protein DICPUDRAFT_55402 [Dictyostelium purpureum]
MNKDSVNISTEEDESQFDNGKVVKLIVVGCGQRGHVYSQYAIERPNRLKIVGVCDPIKYRREKMAKEFGLEQDKIFSDWNDIINLEKFADAVLIATPDQLHRDPAIAFANKGYHLLVEKPLAITEEDCKLIVDAAKKNNVMLSVCHVLRYSPINLKIKELIDSGLIGKVMNIQHLEPIGYYHFAHSYVRGNWSNIEKSSFSLLTKSCHDLDLIHFFFSSPATDGGKSKYSYKKCKKISSFGGLTYFNKENKPKEAGDAKRCLSCPISNKCPYSASKIYLEFYPWKKFVLVPDREPTLENVKLALQNGPYGVCAYESDNDVADQQIVNLEFDDGTTCSFSMVAFTEEMCIRKTRIFGTHGQLECNGSNIVYDDFRFGDKEIFTPKVIQNTKMSNHGASDYYLMRSFVYAVSQNDPTQILSGPDDTLTSHLLVFKAEESRLKNTVINF